MNLNGVLTALFLWAFIGSTHAHMDLIEGQDYTVLSSPQPTNNRKEIEILNFFWYGCPHCDHLQPYLKTWLKNKSSDVNFNDVPAILHMGWIPAAKIFFAAQMMDTVNELHDPTYAAIHQENTNLNDEPTLFDWVATQGIKRDEFILAYQSFTVQKQVIRSIHMTRQYQLTGVPALVIDGKYLLSTTKDKTAEGTIIVLNKLIKKARQEKTIFNRE